MKYPGRSLWHRLFGDRGGREPVTRRRPRARLELEVLEDRLAPATLTWTGQGHTIGTNDGGNWDTGQAPRAGDTLVFGTAAANANIILLAAPAIFQGSLNGPGSSITAPATYAEIHVTAPGVILTGLTFPIHANTVGLLESVATDAVVVDPGASVVLLDMILTAHDTAVEYEAKDPATGRDLSGFGNDVHGPLTIQVGDGGSLAFADGNVEAPVLTATPIIADEVVVKSGSITSANTGVVGFFGNFGSATPTPPIDLGSGLHVSDPSPTQLILQGATTLLDSTGGAQIDMQGGILKTGQGVGNAVSIQNRFVEMDGNFTGPVFVDSAATFTNAAGQSTNISGAFTGQGAGQPVTVGSNGALNLASSALATVNPDGSTTYQSIAFTVQAGGTLSVGDVGGSTSFNLTGGALTITGTPSYTGATTLTGGATLTWNSPAGSLGPTALDVEDSSIMAGQPLRVPRAATMTGTVFLSGSSTVTFADTLTLTGDTTVVVQAGGTLDVAGHLAGSANLTLQDPATPASGNGGNTGGGGGGNPPPPPPPSGPAVFEFDQANPGFSGNVTLLSGTLELGDGQALGSTGHLDLRNVPDAQGNSITTTVQATAASSSTFLGAPNTLTIANLTRFDGNVTLGAPATSNVAFAQPVDVAGDSTVTVAGGRATLAAGLFGTHQFTVGGGGAGPVVIQGTSEYLANVLVQGALTVDAGARWRTHGQVEVLSGATLQVSGTLDVGQGTLLMDLGAILPIPGTLQVEGGADATLSDALTMAGTLALEGGAEVDVANALTVQGAVTLLSSGFTPNRPALLRADPPSALVVLPAQATVGGSGSLLFTGNGSMTLAAEVKPGVTVIAATVGTSLAVNFSGTLDGDATAPATLQVGSRTGSSGPAALATLNLLSGAGGTGTIDVQSNGTLVAAGSPGFAGQVTLEPGGTLQLQADNALGSAVLALRGGQIAVGGAFTLASPVSFQETGVVTLAGGTLLTSGLVALSAAPGATSGDLADTFAIDAGARWILTDKGKLQTATAATLDVEGTGTATLAGEIGAGMTVVVANPTTPADGAGMTADFSGRLDANATLQVSAAVLGSFAPGVTFGTINFLPGAAGFGEIVVQAGGLLVGAGAGSTYQGGVRLEPGGTLELGADDPLGNADVELSGGTIRVDPPVGAALDNGVKFLAPLNTTTVNVTLQGTLFLRGVVDVGPAAGASAGPASFIALAADSGLTFTGTATVQGPGNLSVDGGPVTLAGHVKPHVTIAFGNSSPCTVDFSGTLDESNVTVFVNKGSSLNLLTAAAGDGELDVSGTLTAGAADTHFAGTVSVESGSTLVLRANNALGSADLHVVGDAVVQATDAGVSLANFILVEPNGSLDLTAGRLTLASAGPDVTLGVNAPVGPQQAAPEIDAAQPATLVINERILPFVNGASNDASPGPSTLVLGGTGTITVTAGLPRGLTLDVTNTAGVGLAGSLTDCKVIVSGDGKAVLLPGLFGTAQFDVQGGTLTAQAAPAIDAPVTLEAGATLDAAVDNAFGSGPLTLKGGTLQNVTGKAVTLGNVVTVSGAVTVTANPALDLSGNVTVDSGAVLTIAGGTLGMVKGNAPLGPILEVDGTIKNAGGTLAAQNAQVVIGLFGKIKDGVNGSDEIDLTDGSTLTVEPGGQLIEGGVCTGDSTSRINIAGTLTLLAGGSLTDAGPIQISGVLDVTAGATLNAQGPITVAAGGELIAAGQVSLASFTPAPGFTFDFPVAGAVAGTGYQTLDPTGPVSLAGTNLKVDLAFTPPLGTSLTLIHGTGNVTGAFAGLPEGAVFAANGVPLQITYHGGRGGDVVVTVVPPVASRTDLDVSGWPADAGQPLAFVAHVRGAAPGPLGGTVQFAIDGKNDGAPVPVVQGQAILRIPAGLPAGNYTVTATYSGDVTHLGSVGSSLQQVHFDFRFTRPDGEGDGTHKIGSLVAIGWRLTDFGGVSVSSAAAVTSFQITPLGSDGLPRTPLTLHGAPTYDARQKQFVFRWFTAGLSAGRYRIVVALADGTVHTETITLSAR